MNLQWHNPKGKEFDKRKVYVCLMKPCELEEDDCTETGYEHIGGFRSSGMTILQYNFYTKQWTWGGDLSGTGYGGSISRGFLDSIKKCAEISPLEIA